MSDLATLTTTFTHAGDLRWIGVRPARRAQVKALARAEIVPAGLAEDRRSLDGQGPGKRAVSLIQWEHLAVIAALLGRDDVAPGDLRRNLAVSGINLLGLRKATFGLGGAVLRGTGICALCSRMEETLGRGGYTVLRGHGGITAEVLTPGPIQIGDALTPIPIPTGS